MNEPSPTRLLPTAARALCAAAALLFASLAVAQSGASGAPGAVGDAAADAPAKPTSHVRDVVFEDDMFVERDVMLQGIVATETLTFTTPRSWELTADPVLVLRLDHSAALDPGRSSITVRVNDTAIKSVWLDEDNTVDGRFEARIPRRILEDYNTLQFKVVQHIPAECEDPFDPALWTRVRRDSSIQWRYDDRPYLTDLGELPYPVFDRTGYGPLTIALAGADGVGAAQLTALSKVGFALGRWAAYRGVRFADPVGDPASATTNVLLVGTPATNPYISRYVDTSGLGAGQGLVAQVPNPSNPALGIIVIAGGDAQGLVRAAEAFAGADRNEMLAGNRALVHSIESPWPPETRQSPLPAPPVVEFTLADLGIEDQTVRSFYAPPVRIPLRLEGDSHALIDGADLDVRYAYSAHLDTRLSTMEVRLNGVTLRSVALDDAEGEQEAVLTVDLPFELVEPTSYLEVVFHLFPHNFAPCVYTSDRHIWATVFSDTEFEIHRDHYAMLPDLELLRHDLWPYNLAVGGDGLLIVTSDAPDAYDATAAAGVAANIGRVSVSDNVTIDIVPSTGGLLDQQAKQHAIVLVGSSANSTWNRLERERKATTPGDMRRRLVGTDGDLLDVDVAQGYRTVEQIIHPANPGRTVLVMRAPDQPRLMGVTPVLEQSDVLAQLTGNAAVVDGQIRTVDVAKRVQVGKPEPINRAYLFLRNNWLIIGVVLLLAALIVAWVVRAWARRHGGQAE